MGRRTAVAAFWMVIVASALAATGGTALAACPNEAFRTGPSAFLAECRAYEQVTPVDKESAVAVVEFGPSFASPSVDGVYFSAIAAYAGQGGNFIENPYVALRGGNSWTTQGVGGRQSAPGFAITSFSAVSPDLRYAAIASGEVLAPGAIPGGNNVYIRDNRTGTYALVHASSEPFGGSGPSFGGGTADWSTTYFTVGGGVTEFHDGQARLVVPEASVASGSEIAPNAVSSDGTKFFYFQEGRLYLYRPGVPPLLVSEDEEGTAISGAYFLGATPDAEVAFFQSTYEGTIFRFEAAAPEGERVTEITPPRPGGGTARVTGAVANQDGTYVYFSARGLLTADAEPRGEEEGGPGTAQGFDVYAWHGEPGQAGALRYLGKSEASENSAVFPSVSPDGRFFGFSSLGRVTPDAIDGSLEDCPAGGRCQNVFVYSYDANRITCASCDGSPPLGDSRLGGSSRDPAFNVVHPMLDDGMALFDSPDALLPRDSNGVRDVYAWQDGRPQLVSTGTGSTPSAVSAVSPGGRDIYFSTYQPLVGQDDDAAVDVYDAKVEGGLPQGAKSTSSCLDEVSCRGGTVVGTPSTSPASSSIGGSGNVAGACLALRAKARAARRHSHALTRRARQATGRRARELRKSAAREAKEGKRLGRTAGNCTGGGR